ncbi:hypothetical protein DL93DRAFT_2163871 [Clavulina sp. PMI_390]|nr:hypothetical protein DL93DRAFT_2163871 [Clavulina sp. PMI_390]
MLTALTAALVVAPTLIMATPLAPRSTVCPSSTSGTFVTSELTSSSGVFTGEYLPFSFNAEGNLAFYGDTTHPTITVEFDNCSPNYSNNPNQGMSNAGRLYLPDSGNCLAVTNSDTNGPYTVAALPCPDDADVATAASIPFNWENSRGYFTWIGGNTGTTEQGGCGPAWGFLEDPNTRVPITDASNDYAVSLVCMPESTDTEGQGAFWIQY